MKSVMLSIQPKWCELIANGKKTIEVRKTRPKLETPYKCYIYCTNSKPTIFVDEHFDGYAISHKQNGKVIGEFVCDKIQDFSQWENDYPSLLRHINLCAGTNGDYPFLSGYLGGQKKGYGWHISDLKIYDKPKELSEFKQKVKKCTNGVYYSVKKPLTRPPQSWCYVEEI